MYNVEHAIALATVKSLLVPAWHPDMASTQPTFAVASVFCHTPGAPVTVIAGAFVATFNGPIAALYPLFPAPSVFLKHI